jgi:hypothetical protein
MQLKNIIMLLTASSLLTGCGDDVITFVSDTKPMITQIGVDPWTEHKPGLDTVSNVPDTIGEERDSEDEDSNADDAPLPQSKKKLRTKNTNQASSNAQNLNTLATKAIPAPIAQQESPKPVAIAAPQPNNHWQPNEVLVMRGAELIKGLQRELGRQPTDSEKQNRLQTHMGISGLQAQKVIERLG